MKMLDEKLLKQAPDDIQEILRKSKAETEEEAKNIKLFGEVNFFDVSFNNCTSAIHFEATKPYKQRI